MLKLEEVIGKQLEAERHALADKVAKQVLTCFRSQDPSASLDLAVHGSMVEGGRGGQEQHPGGHQDHGHTIHAPAERCIGLLF
jgi:hypothetical protein